MEPIATATATLNGQTIRAEVYGGPHAGSLVIHDHQRQLITLHMQRFPALLAVLNSVSRQIEDAESEAA